MESVKPTLFFCTPVVFFQKGCEISWDSSFLTAVFPSHQESFPVIFPSIFRHPNLSEKYPKYPNPCNAQKWPNEARHQIWSRFGIPLHRPILGRQIGRAKFGCDQIGTKETYQISPHVFKDFYNISPPFFLISLLPMDRFPLHLAGKLTEFPPFLKDLYHFFSTSEFVTTKLAQTGSPPPIRCFRFFCLSERCALSRRFFLLSPAGVGGVQRSGPLPRPRSTVGLVLNPHSKPKVVLFQNNRARHSFGFDGGMPFNCLPAEGDSTPMMRTP